MNKHEGMVELPLARYHQLHEADEKYKKVNDELLELRSKLMSLITERIAKPSLSFLPDLTLILDKELLMELLELDQKEINRNFDKVLIYAEKKNPGM